MYSKKVSSIEPSPTMEVSSKAKSLMQSGEDVVDFSVGEPDFDTPEYIKDAGIKAIINGKTKYTAASGMDSLKVAIVEKMKKFNSLEYAKENVVISNGAKHSITNVLLSILNPGDEVIISAPYWVSYPEMIKLADGIPVIIDTTAESGFKMTKQDLECHTNDQTKCLILNNPCNPTGTVYTRDELKEIADWAVENQVLVISDEIYERLSYDLPHVSLASFNEEIKKLTITVSGFSKSYAMTGWRLGYTLAEKDITKLMSSLQSQMTSNPSTISQYAGLAALTEEGDEVDLMAQAFAKRRDLLVQLFEEIEGVTVVKPSGAFYAFADVSRTYGKSYNGSKITNSLEFAKVLLEEYKVAVVPGVAFGNDRYVRLSYATSEERIIQGMKRLREFASQIK